MKDGTIPFGIRTRIAAAKGLRWPVGAGARGPAADRTAPLAAVLIAGCGLVSFALLTAATGCR